MNRLVLAHLALLLVNILFGINYHVVKGVVPDVLGPSGFILLRVLGANVLLWFLWSFNPEKITDRKDLGRIAICSLFGICINQLLFFNGLAITSPVNASILMVSSPILVLVMAALILKEKITTRKLIGVILGAAGAIGLILLKDNSPNAQSSVFGDLLVFVNALSYAVYLVLVKPLMTKYRSSTVIAYVFLFGLIWVFPFGITQFREIEWETLTAGNWGSITYVVVATTFLVYSLNAYSLGIVSPTVTSSYMYIQPLIAGILAYVLFTYFNGPLATFSVQKLLLALSIFMGVFLVSYRKIELKK